MSQNGEEQQSSRAANQCNDRVEPVLTYSMQERGGCSREAELAEPFASLRQWKQEESSM